MTGETGDRDPWQIHTALGVPDAPWRIAASHRRHAAPGVPGSGPVSDHELDFVSAARSFAAGRPEESLLRLMPVSLSDEELRERVRQLVAVGAMLTGMRGAVPERDSVAPGRRVSELVSTLVACLVEAGARGDYGFIQLLVAAHSPQVLVDVLVELVMSFGDPPQELFRRLAAQVRRRSAIADLLALAKQAAAVTDDQRRCRLFAVRTQLEGRPSPVPERSAPGGQLLPASGGWRRSSVDKRLHWVSAPILPAEREQSVFAACGRQILPERHTFSPESDGLCVSCRAAHAARAVALGRAGRSGNGEWKATIS